MTQGDAASVQISATIPTALHQRLAHAALDLQRTRSSMVEEAIERLLTSYGYSAQAREMARQ